MNEAAMPRHIRLLSILLLFAAAFCAGTALARLTHHRETSLAVSVEGNWGLSFPQKGQPPVGNATADDLAQYHAHYIGDTSKKTIYLTFDAGYENGYTEAILDALKKHQAPATFFLVGNYIKTAPELVKRMLSEGHTVGNHTFHHPDMSKIASLDTFQDELSSLETLYQETTGQTMPKLYRPPQGKYSTTNLKLANELGYHTFFWSLAYVDWYTDRQPTHEEAFQKLLGRIHPGAIVLLHSTSRTNAEIMDELLTRWEKMGYTFGRLGDLISTTSPATEHTAPASDGMQLPLQAHTAEDLPRR